MCWRFLHAALVVGCCWFYTVAIAVSSSNGDFWSNKLLVSCSCPFIWCGWCVTADWRHGIVVCLWMLIRKWKWFGTVYTNTWKHWLWKCICSSFAGDSMATSPDASSRWDAKSPCTGCGADTLTWWRSEEVGVVLCFPVCYNWVGEGTGALPSHVHQPWDGAEAFGLACGFGER